MASFPTNVVIKSIKSMGPAQLRLKIFFRKAMEAICLLWGRWESLADSMLAIPTRWRGFSLYLILSKNGYFDSELLTFTRSDWTVAL